tara:strand:- start:411 stop:659 length:249 start_codon:yes stop_codon:yes gene_type:complete
MKYKIVGDVIEYVFGGYAEESHEVVLATFDSLELAREYEKKARLKNPTWKSTYRMKSLLGGHTLVHIVPMELEDEPEHNPTL